MRRHTIAKHKYSKIAPTKAQQRQRATTEKNYRSRSQQDQLQTYRL